MSPKNPSDESYNISQTIAPFEVILSSIGDGVIATDNQGSIIFINPIAEKLTGWSVEEAHDQPLEKVFRIINEDTREEVENPALRAIREGVVFGLGNHTILIAKDQTEIPIDDSGSPIRDATGELIGAVLIFRDITERRKTERARGILAAIVHSSEDAIISKSLDGIIDSWNEAAERLFEYTAIEAIGQPISIIIPPERLDEEAMILRRLRRGERIEHLETVRVSKTGRLVNVELTVSPVRNAKAEIIGASKIARDIAKRKAAERERAELIKAEQQARKVAEEASLAKDEFVAQISHELRSPLTSILGWVTLMRAGQVEKKEVSRGLEVIERNAKLQIKLVEDLLDISRAVKGQIHLNVQPVEIGEVMDAALDSIRPALDAKSIYLRSQIKTRNSIVDADPDRLQEILWNLLSNAVKFTPQGGKIEINVARLDHHLEIVVSDSGIGINPKFIPLVFDRFSQARKDHDRKARGLGLGLAIVRHLVELHGGTVSAHSAGEGKGATFKVTLPSKRP
jgi:PAS domain S-box-containing protein